jgi:hypothetical protein
MELGEKIQSLLFENKLCELEELLINQDVKKFREILIDIAFENESIVIYSLVCMMLIKKESIELHELAADLLVHPLCIIEGGYAAALYHTRRIIILSPENIDFKEAIIFFHNVPDKLVTKKEAIQVAHQILEKEPNNKCAKELLDRYNIKV